jgi:Sigma-70 region 2
VQRSGSRLSDVAAFDRLRTAQAFCLWARHPAEVDVDDPYPGLSDRDLAARFDGGDAQALNALCRRHYHTVFRFAYRLTQNRPEAEDCTQETFVRFVRSWPRWRARDRGAGPWLIAIAKNTVADHWQKQLGLTKIAVAGHDVARILPAPITHRTKTRWSENSRWPCETRSSRWNRPAGT